eukprot:TRINITY_DN24832_c0_g1_i2.p1 TRINITY_DN24832_c0_g1~~TRINITY_DN24832_c0_g1_i2.p1  ORF type:complete len:228 (-),score=75.20 TRINITY_DN24832_c0_g1_i2:261-944(-)
MPLSVSQLWDLPSAAFERCRKFGSKKLIAGKKSKDDVMALKFSKLKVQLSCEDEAYDHLLALLSIPAESDRSRPANVPGMMFQEDDEGLTSPFLARMATAQSPTPRMQGSNGQSGSDQQIDLAKIAKEARSMAEAQGMPFPWDDEEKPQNTSQRSKLSPASQDMQGEEAGQEEMQDENAEGALDKALALLARLQAWDVFANADLEHQNRLLRFFGLPAQEAEDEDEV